MSEDTPVCRGVDLTRTFAGVPVVEAVSIDVSPGTLTAIIGPNGSGKSTLLRMLTGLLTPTTGEVVRPETLGYLPQRPAFRPGFTARETLEFYARLAGIEPGPAANQALGVVGLSAAADRRVEALSGGMTGLLGLAQAFIGQPPLVVLDEPATGLDPGIRRHIFDIIGAQRDAGTGVLIASHDLELVEDYADGVVVLETGRLVAEGSPAALCDHYGVSSLEDVFDTAIEHDPTSIEVRGVEP